MTLERFWAIRADNQRRLSGRLGESDFDATFHDALDPRPGSMEQDLSYGESVDLETGER